MTDIIYDLLAALFFIAFFAAIIIGNIRRKRRMMAKNYQWYRATYPEAFRGQRVTCKACGSDHVSVRNVMQRTFMREHFCGQCGESLYYSPEGKA